MAGTHMEELIQLDLEKYDGRVLVSSPQFPLLQLSIEDVSDKGITTSVLPVLKKMIEHETQKKVKLRIIRGYSQAATEMNILPLPPHVIAQMAH